VVVRYDPTRLRFTRVRTLATRAEVVVRAAAIAPGVLRIAAAGASDLADGRLIALFAARSLRASMDDVFAAAATVDEQPARVAVVRGRR
jgi:hypothetical protein